MNKKSAHMAITDIHSEDVVAAEMYVLRAMLLELDCFTTLTDIIFPQRLLYGT